MSKSKINQWAKLAAQMKAMAVKMGPIVVHTQAPKYRPLAGASAAAWGASILTTQPLRPHIMLGAPLVWQISSDPIENMPWKDRQKELAYEIYKNKANLGRTFYYIDHEPYGYSTEFVKMLNALKVFRKREVVDREYLGMCPGGLRGKDKCKKCIKFMKTKTVWEIQQDYFNRRKHNKNSRHPDWGRK